MCLVSLSATPKVADRDIVCYKFLYQTGPFRYITPIREAILWKFPFIKKTFTAEGVRELEMDSMHQKCVVGGGFIHTFAKVSDRYSHRGLYDVVLFRCIIPKGTEYFEHEDGSEYASSRIVILRKEVVWYRPR